MLVARVSLFSVLLIAAISTGTVSTLPHQAGESDDVTGHFTQQNKIETVWLVKPQINVDETGCIVHGGANEQGECVARLNFSDPTVAPIPVPGCIGGTLTNLGDLNGDGLDEIGLLPQWFAGCWRNYHVYTYKNKKWQPAVEPFATHCNQWDEDLPPVIKDPAVPGNVIITYSAFEGTDIVIKTKSVPVK